MVNQRFKGALGEMLDGKLDKPKGEIKAYALFAHCFACGKDLTAVHRIAKYLMKEGIALFRFDFTGVGNSCGDFSDTNFSSNVQDLLAAVTHMRTHLEAPKLLIGHSFGGTAVLAAAHLIPEVTAVATIGAPFDAKHIVTHFGQTVEKIKRDGEGKVMIAGREVTIKKQFLDNVDTHEMEDYIKNLKRALLVMHSPSDETVSIDHAGMIFKHAKHPKSFLSLDKADHLLMNDPKESEYAASVLAAWVHYYL